MFSDDDVLTDDLMNQVQSNMTWIWENTPRAKYIRDTGSFKSTNILIIGGKISGDFAPVASSQWWGGGIGQNNGMSASEKQVAFGETFAPDCIPSVTFGLRNVGSWEGSTISAKNITHQGFTVTVGARTFWLAYRYYEIYWQAVGYK